MKYLLIASALLSSQVFAKDMSFHCEAKVNTSKEFEANVFLKSGSTNFKFGGLEGFDFILSSKAGDVIELQLLNSDEPSRTYATAVVKSTGAFVELSQWKRDYILDLRCTAL